MSCPCQSWPFLLFSQVRKPVLDTLQQWWIVWYQASFQFKLVHVPGTTPDCSGWSVMECYLSKWPGRRGWCTQLAWQTMNFAIVLMNSWPSWASRLKYTMLPNLILIISSGLTHHILAKNLPIVFQPSLRMGNAEVEDTPEIPHSETAQHVDNHLKCLLGILLDPLYNLTKLLESSVQSSHLICFKVLLDGQKAHVPGCPRPSQDSHTKWKVFLPHLLSAMRHLVIEPSFWPTPILGSFGGQCLDWRCQKVVLWPNASLHSGDEGETLSTWYDYPCVWPWDILAHEAFCPSRRTLKHIKWDFAH